MTYTNNIIDEILISVEKIGISKTSRLFNISSSTIYNWINDKKNCKIVNTPKKDAPEKANTRKLVLRRMHLENADIDCYIYNLKDLQSDMEFNGVAYNPNYKTPVSFLKYVLSAYLKETEIVSFQILVKGSTRIHNFDKFSNLIDGCELEILKTDDRFNLDSFNHKQVSEIISKKNLLEFLTDEQLGYNLKRSEDDFKNLKFYPPIILDEFKHDFSSESELIPVFSSLERLINKTKKLLRNANYSLVWESLEVIKLIIEKSENQKTIIQCYNLEIEYYAMQGDYGKALEFLTNSIRNIDEKHDELKFFLVLKICKIHIKNYSIKEFDYYFAKIDRVDFNKFSRDSIMDFHLLMFKRKSLYLPVEESIHFYDDILKKHVKYISPKKLFDIYIQICNLYKKISKFEEAHETLEKAYNLLLLHTDDYRLCEYYLLKCECFLKQGLFTEVAEHCKNLERISKDHNYKNYFFESKELMAFIYINHGKFDLAKIEAEKYFNYGNMTANNNIKLKASKILQKYYTKVGNIQKALKFNQKEIELSELLLDIGHEATAINNRCSLLASIKNLDETPIYINKLEEKNRILKDPALKIRILMYKAHYECPINDNLLSALEFYEKALQAAKKSKIYHMIYIIYSHMAILNKKLKAFKSAIRYINESIYYYSKNDSKYDLPRLFYIKATIYYESLDYTKTRVCLSEAKELAQKYNNQYFIASCLEFEKELSSKI